MKIDLGMVLYHSLIILNTFLLNKYNLVNELMNALYSLYCLYMSTKYIEKTANKEQNSPDDIFFIIFRYQYIISGGED